MLRYGRLPHLTGGPPGPAAAAAATHADDHQAGRLGQVCTALRFHLGRQEPSVGGEDCLEPLDIDPVTRALGLRLSNHTRKP